MLDKHKMEVLQFIVDPVALPGRGKAILKVLIMERHFYGIISTFQYFSYTYIPVLYFLAQPKGLHLVASRAISLHAYSDVLKATNLFWKKGHA